MESEYENFFERGALLRWDKGGERAFKLASR